MKRVFIFITAVFAFLYLVGTLMFFGRYPFRTSVEGINATYKTPGEVSLELMRRTQNQAIEFIVPCIGNGRSKHSCESVFVACEFIP